MVNDLEKCFYNTSRVTHKFPHYFEIYDRYFSRFRDEDVTIVEVGIGHGGSLQMWKEYFGAHAKVYGIDKSTDHSMKDERQITVISGDQSDRNFLRKVKSEIGHIDILIDDGSHRSEDQIVTFEELFYDMSSTGIYVCEDLQTSYQEQFGGGVRKERTFVEYTKRLIDQLNAWCAEDNPEFQKTMYTRSVYAMHFYTYMLVIEKRPMDLILRSPVMSEAKNV